MAYVTRCRAMDVWPPGCEGLGSTHGYKIYLITMVQLQALAACRYDGTCRSTTSAFSDINISGMHRGFDGVVCDRWLMLGLETLISISRFLNHR